MSKRDEACMQITKNSYIHWASFDWEPHKNILANLIKKDLLEEDFIGRLDSGGYLVDSGGQPTNHSCKVQKTSLTDGIGVLSLLLTKWGSSEKAAVYKPGSGPSPEHDHEGTLI